MKKIVRFLALLFAALNVSPNLAQSSSPSTTTKQSVQRQGKRLQKACPGHEHEPGGSAVDINEVNGKAVALYGKNPEVTKAVNDLQASANKSGPGEPGAAAENYGPAGLWRDGKPVQDAKLQDQLHDYVHLLPPQARDSN